jgi:phage FluMu gp28-like protein
MVTGLPAPTLSWLLPDITATRLDGTTFTATLAKADKPDFGSNTVTFTVHRSFGFSEYGASLKV